MPNFQSLNQSQHKDLAVLTDPSYLHSANSHIVPISVFELAQVQAEYPIAFIKDAETGRFHLVAMLGLKPEQNLYHKDGKWNANYVPLQLRNHPFALTAAPETPDQQIVIIDLESPVVIDGKTDMANKEGRVLFNSDGKSSEFLQQVTEQLSNTMAQVPATQDFIGQLVAKKLLTAKSLTIKDEQQQEFNLTGLYAIDEAALAQLSDNDYLELKQKGYVAAIYACLFSTHRIGDLVNRLL